MPSHARTSPRRPKHPNKSFHTRWPIGTPTNCCICYILQNAHRQQSLPPVTRGFACHSQSVEPAKGNTRRPTQQKGLSCPDASQTAASPAQRRASCQSSERRAWRPAHQSAPRQRQPLMVRRTQPPPGPKTPQPETPPRLPGQQVAACQKLVRTKPQRSPSGGGDWVRSSGATSNHISRGQLGERHAQALR